MSDLSFIFIKPELMNLPSEENVYYIALKTPPYENFVIRVDARNIDFTDSSLGIRCNVERCAKDVTEEYFEKIRPDFETHVGQVVSDFINGAIQASLGSSEVNDR